MNEAQSGRLRPSTRINFGLLMLVIGFACMALSVMISWVVGYGLILTFPAGVILLLVGAFQMIRGLRQRAADEQSQ